MTETTREPFRLVIERTIRAPRARVFEAFTRPELVRQWSAPEGLEVEEGAMDVRVGGEWRAVMREVDGDTRHRAFGVYREVTPPSRLVYTHAWLPDDADGPPPVETLLTVEFVEAGQDTTLVRMVHEGFASTESRDGHYEGWSNCFDQLERMFAKSAD